MVNLYNDSRKKVLALLPFGWISKMVIDGAEEPTVWPDEATVYAGTDSEALEVLEKYGMDTPEVRALLN